MFTCGTLRAFGFAVAPPKCLWPVFFCSCDFVVIHCEGDGTVLWLRHSLQHLALLVELVYANVINLVEGKFICSYLKMAT